MSLSKTEFDYRAKEMFDHLSFGLDLETACELSGLDPNEVTKKSDKGRQLYLRGEEIGDLIEFHQYYTWSRNRLKIDVIESLRRIIESGTAASWQAARYLISLNYTVKEESNNGIMAGILDFLNHGTTEE
jgi:hypothetical protein